MEIFVDIEPIGRLEIDQILFESYYPILFTCLDSQSDIYLVVSYHSKSNEKFWLLTKVNPTIIVDLLENKITARDAFLISKEAKYNLSKVNGEFTLIEENRAIWDDINNLSLPTPYEYIDAEEGEFDEEIQYFKSLMTEYSNEEYDLVYEDVSDSMHPNLRLENEGFSFNYSMFERFVFDSDILKGIVEDVVIVDSNIVLPYEITRSVPFTYLDVSFKLERNERLSDSIYFDIRPFASLCA